MNRKPCDVCPIVLDTTIHNTWAIETWQGNETGDTGWTPTQVRSVDGILTTLLHSTCVFLESELFYETSIEFGFTFEQ